jgi:RNA polymerase sigma-70 factor (ECF subfamily)
MSIVCNKDSEERKSQPTTATKTRDQAEIVRLVEEAAGGNFGAFGDLYSIYLDQIYRYVFYQINDKMTAEDITEEVFVKAWKAIGTCKGKEKTFSSWLYRIAHNHLISTLRGMKKFTSIEKYNLVEIIDPQIEVEAEIECQELLEKISCLPKNQKQVIILKFIEGLDNREISKITGKSEGAIRVAQMRALATLRQKLGNEKVWK